MDPVTLRLATSTDAVELCRLAQLDTRRLPPGPHLVAERDGRLHAAISLTTGAVIANPFARTAELCDLLRHAANSRPRRAPGLLGRRRTQLLPAHA
jgi:hypothetical protein